MLRILLAIPLLLIARPSMGQEYHIGENFEFSIQLFDVLAIITVIFLITQALLGLVKMFLQFRLKHKIVDKNLSETLTAQVLATESGNQADQKSNAIRWSLLFMGLGAAFGIISIFQLYGMNALSVLCLALSVSLLLYFVYLHKAEKQQRY